MDIERLKPTNADGFSIGDYIVIQEKIDGANFSIRYDSTNNTIKAFSRRRELDWNNDLRGAWQWAQSLDVDLVRSVLGDNLILFMEWLVAHTVKYPDNKYKTAYCYDIYDTATEQYLPQSEVEEKVKLLDLNFVPVLYKGEFVSWDEVNTYVGKTNMGGDYGEGVVVKNQTKLNDPNTRLPFYVKIVCEQFCETKAHGHKEPVDIVKLEARLKKQELTETIVTKARVIKLLNKMVDDGLISEDWDEHSMPIIAKNLGKEVYYDCKKEEPNIVEDVGELFGKMSASTAMRITREILKERNTLV